MIEKIINRDKIKSSLVSTAGQLIRSSRSPDEGLGELFGDVQVQRIYSDGKTFADLVPRYPMKQIRKHYNIVKGDPEFNIHSFITQNFYDGGQDTVTYKTDQSMSVREHIQELWTVLERKKRLNHGSLIALPNAYVVPGGRFNEQFYWDSYFIMLGLAADNKWDMIEGMIKNYAYMIRKFGFIPTANRTYFLSRSQPPLFSHMIELFAQHKGNSVFIEYLPYMVMEYRFWMKGSSKTSLRTHRAFLRAVQMPSGSLMNRYYDNKETPRPESLDEDRTVAERAIDRETNKLYLHLRAGAESGWDFSSRWFGNLEEGMRSVHTADVVPIDLNSLLHHLESTIADTYRIIRQPLLARKFQIFADRRAKAIETYCWSEAEQFFVDYNFHQETPTRTISLAGVFPLYVKIASVEQAAAVANRLKKDFLKEGGLVTTLVETGQQWDSPNGWAPLQWVTIQGLRHYGYHELANEIKKRWVKTNLDLYQRENKLVEKYNVTRPGQPSAAGEYPLQDGFGWTNGVLAALLDEDE